MIFYPNIPNRFFIIDPDEIDYNIFRSSYNNERVYLHYNIFISYDDIMECRYSFKTFEKIIYEKIFDSIGKISDTYVAEHPNASRPKINIYILTLDHSRSWKPWWRNRAIRVISKMLESAKVIHPYLTYHVESCRYYTTVANHKTVYSIHKNKDTNNITATKYNVSNPTEKEVVYDSNVYKREKMIVNNSMYGYAIRQSIIKSMKKENN